MMSEEDDPTVYDRIQQEIDEINLDIFGQTDPDIFDPQNYMDFFDERRRLRSRKDWLSTLLDMGKTDAVINYMLGQDYIPTL